MAWCPLCERKFENRGALHGHFRFKHGIEYGSGKPAKKTVLTEAIGRSIRRQAEERAERAEEMEKRGEQDKKPKKISKKTPKMEKRGEQGKKLRDVIFRGFGDDKK